MHPNNIGRCGHICNASYAVRKDVRGQHVGEKLVADCKMRAHEYGFRMDDGHYEDIIPHYCEV